MNPRTLTFALVGLAVAIGLVAAGLFFSRGARIILEGKIQKVRIQAIDENSTAILVDFRVTNPSNHTFVLGTGTIEVDTADGRTLVGQTVSDRDAQRFLDAYPLLGPKFNKSMIPSEKLGSKQTNDYMLAARIDAPEAAVNGQKKVRLRLKDVDGPESVIE
jgi:hypothetical protein